MVFFDYNCPMILSAVITEAEEGGFVALNPETGTTSQGESLAEAVENLKEATSLFLEVFPMRSSVPAVMTSFELSHA
jgi:predicted RNase H-like HicB family nuclease